MSDANPMLVPTRSDRSIVLLLYGLSALLVLWFVVDQVTWRHIHVDEFQQAANAQLLVRFGLDSHATGVEPWLIGYGLLTRNLQSSIDVVLVGRAFFATLALCSLIVLAEIQPFDTSRRGRAIATCALVGSLVFWRHAIEVRHDTFQLPAAVAAFWLITLAKEKRTTFLRALVVGVVCSVSTANCLKAVVLFGPLLFVAGIAVRGRLATMAGLAIGASAGALLTFAFVHATGHSAQLWRTIDGLLTSQVANNDNTDFFFVRFGPEPLLSDFFFSEPMWCFGLVVVMVDAFRAKTRSLTIPRILFAPVLAGVLFLYVNPAPYAYNMLAVSPFFILAGLGGLSAIFVRAGTARELACLLVFVQLMAFYRGATRDAYFNVDNTEQSRTIAAAEALTGPNDSVLDGVGMVSTRPPATRHWLLHSALMRAYGSGRRESFARVLEQSPPVVITNYRWAWLSGDVTEALEAAYLQLSPDLWALSPASATPAGTIRVNRAGRYRIEAAGSIGPVALGALAGTHGAIVTLPKATLDYRIDGASGLRLIWVGPVLDLLPDLPAQGPPILIPEGQPY